MKILDVKNFKPLPGFAPIDPSKLANVAIRLTEGRAFRVSARSRTFESLGKTRRAMQQLSRIPRPGESVHCVLNGGYSLYEFIPSFIELSAGRPIDQLRIATLGFSRKNVADIIELVDKNLIGTVAVLCSHYFSAADSAIYRYMVEAFTTRGFNVVAMRTHAKLLLARIGRARLTVESSANLRSCHNIENATIINHPGLYHFHARWFDELIAAAKGAPPCPDRRPRRQ